MSRTIWETKRHLRQTPKISWGPSYQLAFLAFPRITSLEGTGVCLGQRSWELHWSREESHLLFGRTPRGEPQNTTATFMSKHCPETSCLNYPLSCLGCLPCCLLFLAPQ